MATTYHVSPTGADTNPGTSASAPWSTITKANSAVVGGDTVLIHEGTYTGQRIYPTNSGHADAYITYRGVPGEEVPVLTTPPSFQLDTNDTPYTTALVLDGNHHVWIEGIKFSGEAPQPPLGGGASLDSWATLHNADYNVVRDCVFEYARGEVGFHLFGETGSRFNKIINNTMKVVGTYNNGLDSNQPVMEGDVFRIERGSDLNLVEGNDMRYGGRNVINILGSRNLVRSNYFDNNWGEIGGRHASGSEIGYCVGALSVEGNSAEEVAGVGYNLFENNIVTGARQTRYYSRWSSNPCAWKIGGTGQIVRRNFFMDNQFGVCDTTIRGNPVPVGINNHIFNNTFWGNGGELWQLNNRIDIVSCLDGNIFMNNLASQNRRNAFYVESLNRDYDIAITCKKMGHAVVANNRIYHNVFVPADGKTAAMMVTGIGYRTIDWLQDPRFGWTTNIFDNIQWEPEFVPSDGQRDTREEFDLKSDSQLIDLGSFLTRTKLASARDVKQVTVNDAGYFFQGIPEIEVPGDLIRVGTNPAVQVTAIDYVSHTLTLATPVSWTGGATTVNLDYRGKGPEVGAREFNDSAP